MSCFNKKQSIPKKQTYIIPYFLNNYGQAYTWLKYYILIILYKGQVWYEQQITQQWQTAVSLGITLMNDPVFLVLYASCCSLCALQSIHMFSIKFNPNVFSAAKSVPANLSACFHPSQLCITDTKPIARLPPPPAVIVLSPLPHVSPTRGLHLAVVSGL